jgi:hypothetical protein
MSPPAPSCRNSIPRGRCFLPVVACSAHYVRFMCAFMCAIVCTIVCAFMCPFMCVSMCAFMRAFWPAGFSVRSPDQRGRRRRSHLGLCVLLCALLCALKVPKINDRPQPEKRPQKKRPLGNYRPLHMSCTAVSGEKLGATSLPTASGS